MEILNTVKLDQNISNYTQWFRQRRFIIGVVLCIVIITVYIQSRKTKGMGVKPPVFTVTHSKNLSNQTSLSSSQPTFDVVLSYFAENTTLVGQYITELRNLSTIQKRKNRVILYNKNSKIDNTYLKQTTKADIVQSLENLGREGGTYLHYVVDQYDKLADHIIFSQAQPHGRPEHGLSEWFIDRMEKQFNSSVGYMPLVDDSAFAIFDCGERPHDPHKRLPELWAIIEQTICPPTKQFVAFSGQFLVSAKRVRTRPLRIYQYVHDLITANGSHWIHRDPRGIPLHSAPENPSFGHTVERLWTTLFGCTAPDMVDRCKRRECACFD